MLPTLRLLGIVLCTMGLAAAADATASQEIRFELVAPAEAVAEITASAPSASWQRPGAEAAVATVFVDGRYNQDVVIFHGAQRWIYRVLLGPLEAGTHHLRVERNAQWSAPGADLRVEGVHVGSVARSDPEYRAIAHAPILYARADTLGHFSDLPLLMWYEQFPDANGEVIQYSIVFSNEDAGTATDALMARWGRATDLEYIYRVKLDPGGTIREEVFQGREHKDFTFRGRKQGRHPFLLVVSQNNIFADTGFSPLQYRLLPVPADLSHNSREALMDRFPWTYRLMAQELEREGKLRPYGAPVEAAVGDPRQYLYLELNAKNRDSGLVAWVKLKGQPQWYSSHRGRLDLVVSRNGWLRTTVELPPGTTAQSIEYVTIECLDLRDPRNPGSGTQPETLLGEAGQAFLLDSDYRPGQNLLATIRVVALRPGEMYTLIPSVR